MSTPTIANPPADAAPPSFASHAEYFQPPNPTIPRNAETASLRTLPAYTPSRWGNYSTEAEYLTALRAWVEDKQCAAPGDKSLLAGFYGTKTMSDYASAPGLRSGKKERRASEAQVAIEGQGQRRRKSSIGAWLSRRRTEDS
ncbi:hypothetical protein MMC18_004933 [Xylographa bjoerkii]|nr:hypothetical protein [Xylographa bjoerkii]